MILYQPLLYDVVCQALWRTTNTRDMFSVEHYDIYTTSTVCCIVYVNRQSSIDCHVLNITTSTVVLLLLLLYHYYDTVCTVLVLVPTTGMFHYK